MHDNESPHSPMLTVQIGLKIERISKGKYAELFAAERGFTPAEDAYWSKNAMNVSGYVLFRFYYFVVHLLSLFCWGGVRSLFVVYNLPVFLGGGVVLVLCFFVYRSQPESLNIL